MTTPITPMEAYATSDGQLFTDQIEAQAHQHGIDIKPEVWKFLNYDPADKALFGYSYDMAKIIAIINWEVAKKLKELRGEA
jgi:hypothetical protein